MRCLIENLKNQQEPCENQKKGAPEQLGRQWLECGGQCRRISRSGQGLVPDAKSVLANGSEPPRVDSGA